MTHAISLARAEALAVQAMLPAHGLEVEPHHGAELERWLAEHRPSTRPVG